MRLTREPRVVREVTLHTPYSAKPETIKVEFTILNNDRLKVLQDLMLSPPPEKRDDETMEAYGDRVKGHATEVAKIPANILREAIVGWPDDSGIVDDDGQPVPYSETAKSLLLSYEFAVIGLMKYYRQLTNPGQNR